MTARRPVRLVAVVAATVFGCASAAAAPSPSVHPSVSRPTHSPRRTPATPRPTPIASTAELETLGYRLRVPIAGLAPGAIHDTFAEARGERRHEATDIVVPRGTPVLAVDDGSIAKLFTSVPGGLTVYQFSNDGTWSYYYAHLDAYAEDLREGAAVHAGDILGYVGTSGNAGGTPHLHFAIFKRGSEDGWWEGTPVDPFPLLRAAIQR